MQWLKPFAISTAVSLRSSPWSVERLTTNARLKEAYPIHPELFDRLYNDWSSLADKFQRTRGVLRLIGKGNSLPLGSR